MNVNESNYFEELEKIANELAPADTSEPMIEDNHPTVPPEEVEAAQASNAADDDAASAEEQLPVSPDDTAELEAATQAAEEELLAAHEQLAEAEQNFYEFTKVAAPLLEASLPSMGAFAKLIDYSTDPDSDPTLHKLAQQRLQDALSSEDQFYEVLHKTAQELFEDENNLEHLYSEAGMNYVTDTLDSFANNEGLSKQAFEAGAIIGKAVDTVKEFGSATKNFFKLKGELNEAKAAVDAINQKMKNIPNTENHEDMLRYSALLDEKKNANSAVGDVKRRIAMGASGLGTAGVGIAGGSLYGSKKIYDALHKEPEDELSDQIDNVRMNQNHDETEGGILTMAHPYVEGILKVAGAAKLLSIANDERFDNGIRKEATDQFNTISRMSRYDMDESFVKVATELYTEDQLHEIVAGYHNEELFEKVAFFIAANDASADELEKVAGADGVAAKGVAGALTDAKKEVEAHIEEEKRESENSRAGDVPGTVKAQDTSGYNVTNNPEKYDVDKTAYLFEQALLQKQAAVEAYNEAEEFIRYFSN